MRTTGVTHVPLQGNVPGQQFGNNYDDTPSPTVPSDAYHDAICSLRSAICVCFRSESSRLIAPGISTN